MSSNNTVHPSMQAASPPSYYPPPPPSYDASSVHSPKQPTPDATSYPPPPPGATSYPPPPPGATSYPPPPPGHHQPQTSVSTVVQIQPTALVAGQPLPIKLQRSSVQLVCPRCQCCVQTRVSYRIGGFTWLLVVILFLVGLSLGCCLIPLCVNACKDAEHSCPNCGHIVGRCKKI